MMTTAIEGARTPSCGGVGPFQQRLVLQRAAWGYHGHMLRLLFDFFRRAWRWLFATVETPQVEQHDGEPVERQDGGADIVVLDATEDPGPAVQSGKYVLIGPDGHHKWLVFMCPCGCGGDVRLNLMQKFAPRWSVQRTSRGLSVHPSVDMRTCGAHFWLRDGAIVWVGSGMGVE